MKPRVRKERFLEWYFSEENDLCFTGKKVSEALKTKGIYKMTVKKLFYKECTVIPSFLAENITGEDGMIFTENCELVD